MRCSISACADPGNDGPPLYENGRNPITLAVTVSLTCGKGNVIKLVKLSADLSRVPATKFVQTRNRNGIPFYYIEYQIEVTYFSAYTKYELIHDNINYGAVSAEYV